MPKNHINLDFLRENTFGSTENMVELIELFLDTTPEMLVELRQNYESQQWDTLRKTAHKLKSNYFTFGVDELSSPIVKVEMFAGEVTNIEEIGQLIQQIELTTNKVYKELNTELQLLRK